MPAAKRCPSCSRPLDAGQVLRMNTGRTDRCPRCGRTFGWRARPALLAAALGGALVSAPAAGWLVAGVGVWAFLLFLPAALLAVGALAVLAMEPAPAD